MTRAELHRLIDALPDEAVDSAGRLLHLIQVGEVDPEQAWLWSPEWRAGEREADEELARGEPRQVFDDEDAFLDALRERPRQ